MRKISFIGSLQHHIIVDRLIALVVKPTFLAGLYAMSSFMTHARRRFIGNYYDLFGEVMFKAWDETNKTKRGASYYFVKWGLHALLSLCMIDPGYSMNIRALLENFYKEAKKNGLREYR